MMQGERYDLAIIGAGPAGLSTAFAARQAGLSQVVLERGCVADNIRRYPANLVFYSTPQLIELGDVPLIISGQKPTRSEALNYYTRFADLRQLNVKTYQTVVSVSRAADGFKLTTHSHVGQVREWLAGAVVLAFGAYDDPNLLGVPGEDLPHVLHFFDEPERYHGVDVLVVGGKGSASEAALQIWRAGGRVSISYRRAQFSGLKYWVAPDLENRIAEGSIKAYLPSTVTAIHPGHSQLRLADGSHTAVPADFVLALTGYQPRLDLFDQLQVAYHPESKRPLYDPATHQTNVEGVYVAGCLCAGNVGNEIFIENGRAHGPLIVEHARAALIRGA
ncbi:MAG: YpdA family putative bacillithiol disulfide reductase [Armatimonadetes bacterium]|nr:YpdA family putative bacillithiol disulfide reductase [Armatimonadota bacterium]